MADLVNAISGKDGDCWVNDVQIEITEWTLEPSIGAPKYASNLTQNHKVAVAAVGDFTGTITVVIPAGGMPMNLRDTPMLDLYGPVSVLDLIVLITSHPITTDVNDGEPLMLQYTFEPRMPPAFTNINGPGSSSGA